MSSISIIAIKGNHLEKASEIFTTFRYNDLNRDKQFDTWLKAATYLYDNYFGFTKKQIALRGIWADKGWTIVCDPELVDTADSKALETLSQTFNAEVMTFLIQTTSNTFEFSKYNTNKLRHFFYTDGQIAENFGTPLAEELGLNINEKIFIDDMNHLANKLGIDLEVKNTKTIFTIKELGYNDEMIKELEQFKQPLTQKTNETEKPWWKIW